MSEVYLDNPIDVAVFDKQFRIAREGMLDKAVFTGFNQTPTRWQAIYQDEEMSLKFEGDVSRTTKWLKEPRP